MMFGQGAGGDLRYVDDVWAGGRGRLEVCR